MDSGANGSDHYIFTGIGFTQTTDDPDLYLARGNVYEFVNNMDNHPFRIQSTQNGSTGTQYNTGVTNNDAYDGTTLRFEVPFSAPDTFTISVFHTLEWVEPSSSIQPLDNYSK